MNAPLDNLEWARTARPGFFALIWNALSSLVASRERWVKVAEDLNAHRGVDAEIASALAYKAFRLSIAHTRKMDIMLDWILVAADRDLTDLQVMAGVPASDAAFLSVFDCEEKRTTAALRDWRLQHFCAP